MKYYLIVCLCIWISVETSGQYNADNIKIMTYNIRLDYAGDNENNWHHRKLELCQFIQESNSDFIGLQEAIDHQLNLIDNSLDDFTYIGVGRDDGRSRGEFSPILYDSTKWDIVESNTFWLSEIPFKISKGWDAACKRVLTYGVFKHKNGDKVLIANTHFDHVGKKARSESIKLINDFLNSFKADLPKILMGDFNFTPDDENYALINMIVGDSYENTFSKSGHLATYNGFQSDAEATRRIDYIFTSKNVDVINHETKTPKTKKGHQLSDHFPVLLTCKIKM